MTTFICKPPPVPSPPCLAIALTCAIGLPAAVGQLWAQAPPPPQEETSISRAHLSAIPGGAIPGGGVSGPTIVLRPAIPAYFPGCDHLPEGTPEKSTCSMEKLMRYIGREVVYPDSAREAGIQGVTILTFVVTDAGDIRQITVLRDIGGGCGDEAARVIAAMPRWEAAFHDGAPAYTQFTLPITFGLRANEYDYALQTGGLEEGDATREELLRLATEGEYVVTDPRGTPLTITEVVYTLERGDTQTQLVTRGAERPDERTFARFLGRRPARLTVEVNAVDGLDIRTVARQFALVR